MSVFLKNSWCLVFALLFYTCQSTKEYTTKPSKSLKNPDSDLLEVNVVAYHLSDSTSKLYLRINNENLLYKRPDTTKAFYASLKVNYSIRPDATSKQLTDSGSFYLNDRAEGEVIALKYLYVQKGVKLNSGANYLLEIEIVDLNKRVKYLHGLNLFKENKFQAQNYLITKNDTVVFNGNLNSRDDLLIYFSNKQLSQINVQRFSQDFGPALPPFSAKEVVEPVFQPDSVFTMYLNTNQFIIKMPQQGFYHIQASHDDNEGLNLFAYDENFPGVANSNEMISCTRYIMSKEEYEECKSAKDQKLCIDNFWLNIAGSHERAREFLKRYYGRVKEANKNFSSFTQGWKSDRGMIFIVFGPPLNIYRSKKDEVWVYGNESNPNSLRFVFNKTANAYSKNHYVMERSQFYKDAWYAAVEQWREGRIYLESNK